MGEGGREKEELRGGEGVGEGVAGGRKEGSSRSIAVRGWRRRKVVLVVVVGGKGEQE